LTPDCCLLLAGYFEPTELLLQPILWKQNSSLLTLDPSTGFVMLKLLSHRACQKMCWRKNQHNEIWGQVFAKLQKVNLACQSIWPAIDKERINIKFKIVSAGIPNNSRVGVSASFADRESDKKIFNASVKEQTYQQVGWYGKRQISREEPIACV
jgi:hypothetical protein